MTHRVMTLLSIVVLSTAFVLPLQILSTTPAGATAAGPTATLAASPSSVHPDGTIDYTAVITNNNSAGGADYTNVSYSDALDSHTTPVAGSLHASPIAFDYSYTGVGNTRLYAGTTVPSGEPAVAAATGFLAKDTAPTDSIQFVSTTNPTHGTVSANSDGTFTYLPNRGYTGSDSFTYTIENSSDHSLQSTGTVTITLANRVWYANDSTSNTDSTTCGTVAAPCHGLSDAVGNAASGDYIYAFKGNANYGGATLGSGEQLIGAGTDLTVGGTTLLPGDADSFPTIGGTLTVASNDSVVGLNVSSGTSTALAGTTVTGLSVSNVGVTSTTGTAVSFSSVSGTVSLNGVSASGGTNGISLTSETGSFSATGGSLSSITGTAFLVSGGSANVTYPGSISTSGSGRSVQVQNATGGTIGFSGAIADTGSGISLTNNTGTTINFTDALSLNTGGNDAFTATGGGTVNVTARSGGLGYVQLTAAGTGYTSLPSVGFSGGGGSGASASAVANIGAVNVTSGGSGYSATSPPTVTFSGGGGSGAAATATVVGGSITSITITNRGSGYTSLPTVGFTGGTGGGGAAASAVLSLTGVNLTSTGSNFTSAPSVNITGGGGSGATASAVPGGASTIATTTGKAVNIANTTIGPSGITFQSISHNGSNGSNSAIVLNNTGSGAFTVTGNGGACTPTITTCTGGTIQNVQGADGVSLSTVGGVVTLSNLMIQNMSASTDASAADENRSGVDGIQGQAMSGGLMVIGSTIQNVSDSGINGSADAGNNNGGVPVGTTATTFSNLTVSNCTIQNADRFAISGHADSTNEAAVFMFGVKGTVSVMGSTFQNAAGGLFFTTDTAGSLDMSVTSNQFITLYKEPGGTAGRGNYGVRVLQEGSLASTVRVGDVSDTNTTLGNTFTNGGYDASIQALSENTSTGAMKAEINRNVSTVTDHSTPGVAAGSTNYNFPQGGALLRARGSGNYEAVFGHNFFDQAMHADQATIGNLSISAEKGTSEFIVQNNTFKLPWDAPVQILANGTGGSPTADAQVLMSGNHYVSGTVGDNTTDLGGPSPYDPFYAQTENGGRLDLTIQNEATPFATNDSSSGFSHAFFAETANPGDILNLFLQNTSSATGYELKASSGTTFNLYKYTSASGTAQGVLNDNGNSGTAYLTGAGTVNLSTSAPGQPSITVSTPIRGSNGVSPHRAVSGKRARKAGRVKASAIHRHRHEALSRFHRQTPRSHTVRPNDISGNTASVTIGTLPATKSVTIKYQATVASAPGAVTISTQGTVSVSGFSNVLTDDPNTVTSGDATKTPVDLFTTQVAVGLDPSSNNPSTYGDSVTFTASVTSTASGTPSGSVTFYDGDPSSGGTKIGNVKSLSSGSATSDSTSTLPAGSPDTIFAVYTGDNRFKGNQDSRGQTVNPATLTMVCDDQNMTYGDSVPSLTYTVNGAQNGDTGVTTGSGSCTSSATSSSPVGPYTITASNGTLAAANGNYTLSSTPTDGTLTIGKRDLTVTPDDVVVNSSFSQSPVLTGTITGQVSGDGITAAYDNGGATPSSAPGTYPITATLNDPNTKLGNYNVTKNQGSYIVTGATTNLLIFNGPTDIHGPISSGTTVSATFTQSDGTTGISGEPVTFTFAPYDQSNRQTCTGTTNGAGVASCQLSNLATGHRWLEVSFKGDTGIPAQAIQSQVTVHHGTLAFTGPTTVQGGIQSTAFTATLKDGSTPLSSEPLTFTFAPNSAHPQTCVNVNTNASGVATCNLNNLPTGTYTMLVSFAGDSSWSAQTIQASVTVDRGVVAYTGPANIQGGVQSTAFTASFTSNGSGVANKPLTFTFAPASAHPLSCTNVNTNSSGVATCNLANLPTGVHGMVVSFAGDSSYQARTISSNVNVVPAVITYTGPTSITNPAGTHTFTATLTAGTGGSGLPSEPVTFTYGPGSGHPVSRTVNTDANGAASCDLSNLPSGNRTLVISFAGDGTYPAASINKAITST